MMNLIDLIELRSDFPMLKKKIQGHPLIYFDTAATSLKPRAVIDALTNFYSHSYGTVHRALYSLAREATEAYNASRITVQKFINAAHSDEIIFTRGTTASLNLLARSFAKAFLKPNDAIILTQIEHHSNLVPWQMIAEETGARIRIAPVNDDGEIILNEFQSLLDEHVKIVSIAHISNVLGTLHPVKEIIALAHQVGAKVSLDGAQAVGHLPIDVQDLDVDFYAFSGHKIYGPTGIGVLYGKKELLEKMPPIEGGGDMIEHVTLEKSTYQHAPLKFEAGTPPIADAIGLSAAIDYLSQIGMDAIHSHEKHLLDYATEKLLHIPEVYIVGMSKEKGAIISFIVEGIHPLDLATFLDFKGIAIRTGHQCSQPAMERFDISSVSRISFGLYNTEEEIDLFCEELRNVISILK